MTDSDEKNERRYGRWAGNERGYPENKVRCIERVSGGWMSKQCDRKRGFGRGGLYCKQHAKRYPEEME